MSILYSGIVLADGPLAYYRLDDTSGNHVQDFTGNGNTGNDHGTVTVSQPGAIFGDPDTCQLFDGVSGYVSTPVSPGGFTALTLELWIKLTSLTIPTSPAAIGSDLTQATNHGSVMYFGGDGQSLVFAIGNGTNNNIVSKGTVITTSAFIYAVGTWDGTTMKFSINAGSQASHAMTGTISSTNTFSIAHNTAGTDFLPAYVDEVAIYNKALTPTQINTHYIAGLESLMLRQQTRHHFGRRQ